jgi:hypothetical protein
MTCQASRQLARGAALLPLVLIALVLLLPAAALGATRATGSLDGSGTSYTLTVHNTGDQFVYCMEFFAAPGVKVKSVAAPGTLQGPSGFSAETNIAPGASQTFSFTTEQQYPPGSGGTLNVSSTCSPGSDVTSQVSGPPQPPVGGPAPCRCFAIGAKLQAIHLRGHHGQFLAFRVRWGLQCTPGPGPGCRGLIKLAADDAANVKILRPKSKSVKCKGGCFGLHHGSKRFRLSLSKNLRPLAEVIDKHSAIWLRKRLKELEKEKPPRFPYPPLQVHVNLFCINAAGKPHAVNQLLMTFKFDRQGQVNRKRSDLNGDGREDARPHRVVGPGP